MMMKNPLVWMLAAGGVVVILHLLWFVFLPMQLRGSDDPATRKRRRQLLERVVAMPSLLGDQIKLVARLGLLPLYFGEEDFAKLEATCRAILAHDVPPGIESDTRIRLAQSLEAQGRIEEARIERQRSQRALKLGEKDVLHYLSQGKLLKDQRRFAEAYECFERALEQAPESDSAQRAYVMSELMLAAFNMGRADLSAHWAEEAIAINPDGETAPVCHRMAGLSLSNLGRYQESQTHWQWAYDRAVKVGDTKVQGECLAMMGTLLWKQGRLTEAFETATRAEKIGARAGLAVQADVLRSQGRFDESIATLRKSMATPGFKLPSDERRVQGAMVMSIAQTEAEAGRGNEAWQHLQEATRELSTDPKLGFLCDAGTAWALAHKGEAGPSRNMSQMVLNRLPQFEQDRTTYFSALSALGFAASARGDHEEAERFWMRYLDAGPDPVQRPRGLYQLGLSREHLGDRQSASECYRQACAFDFETHYTQLARKRLKETAFESL